MNTQRPSKRYLIVLGLETLLALILFFTRGGTDLTGKAFFSVLCDATFVPGILTFCFGLLVIVSNGGVFDMVRYIFAKAGNSFRREENRRELPNTYYDYVCMRHGGKRAQFGFILICGAIFIGVSIVFCLFAV